MKRFFIFFSLFAVLSSSFIVLLNNTAFAASPYDDFIKTTSKLEVATDLSVKDITLDWSSPLFVVPTHNVNSTGYMDGATDPNATQSVPFTYFANSNQQNNGQTVRDAWAQRENWAVTQYGGTYASVVVSWTNDPNPNIVFSGSGSSRLLSYSVASGYQTWQISMPGYCWASNWAFTANGRDGCGIGMGLMSTSNSIMIENSGVPVSLYFAMGNVIYPSGYDGDDIPEQPAGPSTSYTPKVGYTTFDDKNMQALYIGDTSVCIPNSVGGCNQPNIKWQILDSDKDEMFTYFGKLASIFNYTLPGNQTYYLTAQFAHPGVPWAPFADDVDLQMVVIKIDYNGTFVSGSTELNECSVTGGELNCEPADPLEDCTTYGVDIGGYFQCIINNFGTWLRNQLIALFVPKYDFYGTWNDSFGVYLNNKLGFVYSSFGFVTGSFTAMISNGATGSCNLAPPGTIFGQSFSVNVCSFQTIIGNIAWGLLQGLVIGVTILLLAFAAYRKYLEVVDNR